MNKIRIMSFLCLLLLSNVVRAQGPGGGDGDPFIDGDPGEEEVPIDGGVSYIVAAAALYGIKRLRDQPE